MVEKNKVIERSFGWIGHEIQVALDNPSPVTPMCTKSHRCNLRLIAIPCSFVNRGIKNARN